MYKHSIYSKENIAYCAGIFDGEGSVFIVYDKIKNSYILHATVTLCDLNVLEVFQAAWGGRIQHHKARQSHHRGYDEWCLKNSGADMFIKDIITYSIIKKPQLILALEFLSTILYKPGRGHVVPSHIQTRREEIKLELRAHKTKGKGLIGAS